MRYEDVPTDEAIDLIHMLPDGSRWVARRFPLREWDAQRHRFADVLDAIKELTWALAYDREKVPDPPTVTRPRDVLARAVERERARSVRERLEQTGWEEL